MPDFESAAFVVWLDADEQLSEHTFEVEEAKLPERRGFWSLGAALAFASIPRDDKLAWIKVDRTILDPDDVREAYGRFKSGAEF